MKLLNFSNVYYVQLFKMVIKNSKFSCILLQFIRIRIMLIVANNIVSHICMLPREKIVNIFIIKKIATMYGDRY